ncbi:ring-cleaving dioxygenase [Heyndrickxia oleronia]|jgi:glyoxalase family protein|uniref:Ring-cleaving dioxygenase n=1 Tax=Heyndrickxia oleronia TaxID=38875 RepID=A0AAW6T116_9BACI|nr:ring-cleaving dioxygenase [Heyndrickxia oleronia]MCM3240523.1 ring-cleaving dioxygenase [Heyndrickxia oleronia]MDH5163238.1 ring-cleaving dioxygenase [Heyndrickxia oleronia]
MQSVGIHHITAIVGDPQENVHFYSEILGLRLVKKTVNFDDPGTYHLYFGDESGNPGTIITFFPWINAYKGRIGDGQVGVTAYAVPEGALSFWKNRLTQNDIHFDTVVRFEEESILFNDPHGLILEIVERKEGKKSEWEMDDISTDVAIKGFAGATLFSGAPNKTMNLLEEHMGLEKVGEEGEYIRYRSIADIGNVIDIKLTTTGRGSMGVGTVHHIAWRTKDDNEQLEWQKYLPTAGYQVTPVQDRNYFNAVYFREFGGILFEIATDPPGFAIDEPKEQLGEHLMLPARYEGYRQQLEATLPPIHIEKNRRNEK